MKFILFIFFSIIVVNIVYCRTIGQSLDAGIAHAQEDAEAVGRVITAPFRYVGDKARYAVASTRHVAGDVVEGAAQKLHRAGQSIRGDDDVDDEPSRPSQPTQQSQPAPPVQPAQPAQATQTVQKADK
uniref:Uncharacterized protein n=1 Tax=Panagrolaimus sp. ES5 TaxID=591445 RepID=A0AC34GNV4_9BILA